MPASNRRWPDSQDKPPTGDAAAAVTSGTGATVSAALGVMRRTSPTAGRLAQAIIARLRAGKRMHATAVYEEDRSLYRGVLDCPGQLRLDAIVRCPRGPGCGGEAIEG